MPRKKPTAFIVINSKFIWETIYSSEEGSLKSILPKPKLTARLFNRPFNFLLSLQTEKSILFKHKEQFNHINYTQKIQKFMHFIDRNLFVLDIFSNSFADCLGYLIKCVKINSVWENFTFIFFNLLLSFNELENFKANINSQTKKLRRVQLGSLYRLLFAFFYLFISMM